MTDAAPRENRCYRHPDRESYIRCQRCGRTICAECQTQAAVGVHCPECVREARQEMPRTTPRIINAFRRPGNRPIVTYTLIGINVLVYLVQVLGGSRVEQALLYYAPYTLIEPWRMLTYAFAHASPIHILLNMYSLFIIGPLVEHMLGRARYLTLYLISAFAGAVGVLLIAPGVPVVGASGAIFGLLGAYFVISRRLGGNSTQLLVLIGINLVIGFIPGFGIAWQAHVGGLVVGAALALIFVGTRNRSQRVIQVAAVAGVAVLLVAITAVRFLI